MELTLKQRHNIMLSASLITDRMLAISTLTRKKLVVSEMAFEIASNMAKLKLEVSDLELVAFDIISDIHKPDCPPPLPFKK